MCCCVMYCFRHCCVCLRSTHTSRNIHERNHHGRKDRKEPGAIKIDCGGNAHVEKCIFRDNSGGRGGAIFTDGATLTSIDNVFQRNKSNTGGGIYNFGDLLVLRNTFIGNEAKYVAAAIFQFKGKAEITSSTFSLSKAPRGKDVVVDGSSKLVINHSPLEFEKCGEDLDYFCSGWINPNGPAAVVPRKASDRSRDRPHKINAI